MKVQELPPTSCSSPALQILYSSPYRAGLRYGQVKELDTATKRPPLGASRERLWTAYEALQSGRGYRSGEERIIQNGEAELEVVQTYTSGDLVVLVVIERQHGEVGGLPDQDWSLRVTWVFRREGSQWRQVHRHADPLVYGISALGCVPVRYLSGLFR